MDIVAKGLLKRFGGITAVDDVSLDVARGECVALLGPNGAGKTTIVRMFGCVSRPDAGELTVLGMDALTSGKRIRARLGVVPQEDSLDPDLKVEQNLRVYGRYFNIDRTTATKRAKEALEFVGLTGRRKSRIEELSGGMKRRLVIARALINEPDILLLDEPTTGLDPQARRLVWERFRSLEGRVTRVLTTHYMEEAETLADRVFIIHLGKILDVGRPGELIERHVGQYTLEVTGKEVSPPKGVVSHTTVGTIYLHAREKEQLARVDTAGASRVTRRRSNLTDVFLRLSGRSLEG